MQQKVQPPTKHTLTNQVSSHNATAVLSLHLIMEFSITGFYAAVLLHVCNDLYISLPPIIMQSINMCALLQSFLTRWNAAHWNASTLSISQNLDNSAVIWNKAVERENLVLGLAPIFLNQFCMLCRWCSEHVPPQTVWLHNGWWPCVYWLRLWAKLDTRQFSGDAMRFALYILALLTFYCVVAIAVM